MKAFYGLLSQNVILELFWNRPCIYFWLQGGGKQGRTEDFKKVVAATKCCENYLRPAKRLRSSLFTAPPLLFDQL